MLQARRLVKNSIIAVEAPDEDMADDDWVDDQEEADEVLARHRRPASAAGQLAPRDCRLPRGADEQVQRHGSRLKVACG